MGDAACVPGSALVGATRQGTGSAIRNGLSGARVCGEAVWLAPHGRKAAPGKNPWANIMSPVRGAWRVRRPHRKSPWTAPTKRFTSCYSTLNAACTISSPKNHSKPLKRWLRAALACRERTRQVELTDKWAHCASPTDFHLLA
ncbi:hypothetical protein P3T25_003151 [Paraburkholderia sp. GAS32]